MLSSLDRRTFLTGLTASAASVAMGAGPPVAKPWKTTLKKALIGVPSEATLRAWKAAGFDGMESTDRTATPERAAAARKLAEGLGMRIHSVLFGWANFNQPAAVERDIAAVETALRACQAYGADALLLVPCKIGGMAVPEAWEFDLRFDEKTGRLRQVVPGDNTKYARYIEAHNQAADASREAVKRLVPTAEKAGVVIALENVWNNLWVKPELFKAFVASFDSPSVRAYFDIGNHVKYAPPQEWIRTLGKLIVKCHVKDFKLAPDGHGGKFSAIREGSVDWPAVRTALDEVGYNGWMTIEGNEVPALDEQNRRLDLIIAGK
jgi:L-ribulose-5-phosphate 3-epimerase